MRHRAETREHHHPPGRGQSSHDHGSHPARRPAPSRSSYTLAHAGRQMRLGPITFWIVVGSLVIMAGWTLATGTYFTFKDDVLARLIARQAEQQFSYEDRIAELRAQIDRTASRQLLDQEQFDQKLDQIQRRQSLLESRAATMTGVPDPTPTGSIGRGRPGPASVHSAPPKPSPINDTAIFTAPPDREARLESRALPASVNRYAATAPAGKQARAGIDGIISRLNASLDRVEARQVATLNTLEESYDTKTKRIRGVLSDLGVDPRKSRAPSGVGGPFIPVKLAANAGAFERQLYRIKIARSQLDQLTHTLVDVPVRKPIVGDIDLSSSFGVRSDPFGRGPAMHSGLDFRSSMGDPVRATANGKVVTAGWNGGYGNMVEISHGNGFSTRYGHMSKIEVKVGQSVKIGQTIGRVGSTGRSTGPHLHYETRIDGEAVDPQKFLRAGLRLGNVL